MPEISDNPEKTAIIDNGFRIVGIFSNTTSPF